MSHTPNDTTEREPNTFGRMKAGIDSYK